MIASARANPTLQGALDAGYLGLYPAANFRLARGSEATGDAPAAALWYFADEMIALPRAGEPTAGFARAMTAWEDVARWATAQPQNAPLSYPPLIWVGSPHVIRGLRLADDGYHAAAGDVTLRFGVVEKIALNRSYYDATSRAFMSRRSLSVRGTLEAGSLTARTLWPEDFRLDRAAPSQRVDASAEAVRSLVRGDERGGAASPFAASVLWERTPGASREWNHKPVLAALLNGAQGDDDEAHAGHFALITGHVGVEGAIGDWLANNFYTLDNYSEKGIIAAPVPLDAYLADLNSGQAWYRPTSVIVALLRSPQAAARIQGALGRVYNQLYRHQLAYRHATMNCAGISIDVLRALGWNVKARGPTGRLVAALGFPYIALRERSLEKAMQTADYLSEDQTRLLPAAAFEEVAADLLQMATGRLGRVPTAFESAVAGDIDALIFLRIPQLPSSRALGDFPVVTIPEYQARMPADPADAQIVPVPARPFPAAMRDGDLLRPSPRAGQRIAAAWGAAAMVALSWLAARLWKGRRRR